MRVLRTCRKEAIAMLLLSNLIDYVRNPFASIGTFIWVIILFIAIKNIWQSQNRGETDKILWTGLVFFFPIIGVIIWWIFGGKEEKSEA